MICVRFLANDVAVKAYQEGKLPFPDGAIITRLACRYVPSEENNEVFGRPQSFTLGGRFHLRGSRLYKTQMLIKKTGSADPR
jgi:hypothetical protein